MPKDANSGIPIELSIVIPAYNEQNRIQPTLEEYVDVFRAAYAERFEIVVVLNGCTDDTLGVVQSVSAQAQEVRILDVAEPLGKGGAVWRGLNQSYGRLLVFVDADNMVRAPEAKKLVDALASHDVAIADRFTGEQTNGRQPALRRLISLGSRIWVRRFLGLPYSDTQCGAKAFQATAWRAIAPRIEERGWAFDLDALAQAMRLNLSVAEVPVKWQHIVEGSKVQPWRDVPATLWATFRIKNRARR